MAHPGHPVGTRNAGNVTLTLGSLADVPAQPRPPVRPGKNLRALLLAVQVLSDVDMTLTDAGLALPGGRLLRWPHVRLAARGMAAGSTRDRARMADWLQTVGRLAALPGDALPDLVRPVGLPSADGRAAEPGWSLEVVLGGALHLGVGVLGLHPQEPDRVVVVPASAWRALDLAAGTWWLRCRRHLEAMGALAARRWELSERGELRPMGDCDVVTLLGAGTLRAALAGSDGGMRAVVVPMRTRGWTRLSRLDPAFAPAAAMATATPDRGFLRPLLITADEVVLAGDGGRTDISVADPIVERWDRSVLRH
jgi:hypothetical protein